jgi:Leucine-rich repeat (LRR) protein
MPNYHDLEYLYLTANKISDSEVCYLVKYRKLRVLGLAENNISKLDVFKEFRKFINLEDLELENNPVSYLEEYRETAF